MQLWFWPKVTSSCWYTYHELFTSGTNFKNGIATTDCTVNYGYFLVTVWRRLTPLSKISIEGLVSLSKSCLRLRHHLQTKYFTILIKEFRVGSTAAKAFDLTERNLQKITETSFICQLYEEFHSAKWRIPSEAFSWIFSFMSGSTIRIHLKRNTFLFIKKMCNPWHLFRLFSVFFKETPIQFS